MSVKEPIVDQGQVDVAVLGYVDEGGDTPTGDVTIVRQVSKTIDLFRDEVPGYPEDLHIYPKNYTIRLSKEHWHPLSELDPSTLN